MGVSFSYPFEDFDDLSGIDEDFEEVIMRSLACNVDEVKTKWRSATFNGRESEHTLLRSFGSGHMFIDGTLNMNRIELDPFHLETKIQSTTKIPLQSTSPPKETPLRSISIGNEITALRSISIKREQIENPSPVESTFSFNNAAIPPQPESSGIRHQAALKLQKVYKSFQTRRRLADCAVLAEQHWWNLLDFAVLKRNSVSFFDIEKQETAVSRWSRARTRAAMVGRGLSKDQKARKLALQHWLEAIDPRHRYGHNLHMYYVSWLHCESKQPFFYWLDVGEGRDFSLEECPRQKLQHQCIKYLCPSEREDYEVTVEGGNFRFKKTGELLDTSGPAQRKWIFVLSTLKKLYVGKKEKGTFQHSSFLAGGATSAAGRLVVENGVLKAVWPHSGHYRPTTENFQEFVNFLKERNVDFADVQESPLEDDDEWRDQADQGKDSSQVDSSRVDLGRPTTDPSTNNNTNTQKDPEVKQSRASRHRPSKISIPPSTVLYERLKNEVENQSKGGLSSPQKTCMFHKWNLFDDQEIEEEEPVPPEKIVRRIASRKLRKSYQLGEQLSFRWTSGLGPRIGCVRDYPTELQNRALEEVLLSPRSVGSRPYTPRTGGGFSPMKLGTPKQFSSPKRFPTSQALGPFHSCLNPKPFPQCRGAKRSPSCLSPKPSPTSPMPKPLPTRPSSPSEVTSSEERTDNGLIE